MIVATTERVFLNDAFCVFSVCDATDLILTATAKPRLNSCPDDVLSDTALVDQCTESVGVHVLTALS